MNSWFHGLLVGAAVGLLVAACNGTAKMEREAVHVESGAVRPAANIGTKQFRNETAGTVTGEGNTQSIRVSYRDPWAIGAGAAIGWLAPTPLGLLRRWGERRKRTRTRRRQELPDSCLS